MITKYQLYLINAKKVAITKNFTLFEVCNSDTALAKGIDNRPSQDVVKKSIALIKNVLQPVRDHFKAPLKVNCIYRCAELNKLVGGVSTSQHVKGEACDFVINGINLFEIFDWIKHNTSFDQLIYEKSGTSQWIHVSYISTSKNRKQSLKLVNGKYIAA